MGFNFGSISRVVNNPAVNPISYGLQQVGQRVGGNVGAAVGSPIGTAANGIAGQPNTPQATSANGTGAPIMTPDQQYAARSADYQTGLAHGQALFQNDPNQVMIRNMRQNSLQGFNSAQNTALRDQMQRGLQSQTQNGLRQMMSQQARGGVGGARAAAQQAAYMNSANANRAAAEQDMFVKNIDQKQKALDAYEGTIGKQALGTQTSALGEQALGVGDRTGYQQSMIANAMAQAAQNQPTGILSQIFGPKGMGLTS